MKACGFKAVLILVAIGAGVLMFTFRSREPRFRHKPLGYWLAELKNANPARQELARDALHEIGVPAVPFLLQMARSECSLVKRFHREAWFRLPGTVQRYFKEPESEDAALSRISHALHQLGPAAGPVLMKALDDWNSGVRCAVGGSFPYPLHSPASAQWLAKLLETADYDLKQAAAGMLGVMGTNARPAVPALLRAMRRDEDHYVRETAARSVARLSGSEMAPFASSIRGCLQNPVANVRLWSAIPLWRINRDPNGINVLTADLKNASAEDGTCHAVIQTLGQAGASAKPAVPEIRRIMLQFNPERLLPEGGAALVQTAREALRLIDPEIDPVEMLVP